MAVKIGRPGYRVTKQFDPETKQRSLLFQVCILCSSDVLLYTSGMSSRLIFSLSQSLFIWKWFIYFSALWSVLRVCQKTQNWTYVLELITMSSFLCAFSFVADYFSLSLWRHYMPKIHVLWFNQNNFSFLVLLFGTSQPEICFIITCWRNLNHVLYIKLCAFTMFR